MFWKLPPSQTGPGNANSLGFLGLAHVLGEGEALVAY